MLSIKDAIIDKVFEDKSFLVGCFSKPNTPIVIPMWAGVSVSDPKFLKRIGKEFAKILRRLDTPDLLCGIATTGISIASTTSLYSKIPWIFARGERKLYGSKEAFDGTYWRGARVVFLDNLSAKGKGMIPVFEESDSEGFVYSNLLTIVDYTTWEKVPEFTEKKLQIHSLITAHELVEGLNKKGYFPGDIYNLLISFLNSPQDWVKDSEIVDRFQKEIEQYFDKEYIRDIR